MRLYIIHGINVVNRAEDDRDRLANRKTRLLISLSYYFIIMKIHIH